MNSAFTMSISFHIAICLTGETVETAVHLHAGVFIPVEGTAHHAVPFYGEAVQLRCLPGRDGIFYVRKDRGATLRPNNIGLSSVKISHIEWETPHGPVIHVTSAACALPPL